MSESLKPNENALATAFREYWQDVLNQLAAGVDLAERHEGDFLAPTPEERLELARDYFTVARAQYFADMPPEAVRKQLAPLQGLLDDDEPDVVTMARRVVADRYIVSTEGRLLSLPSQLAEFPEFLADYDDPMLDVSIYKATAEPFTDAEAAMAAAVLYDTVDIPACSVMSICRGDLDTYNGDENCLSLRCSFSGEEPWPDHEIERDDDDDEDADDEDADEEDDDGDAAPSKVLKGRLVSVTAGEDGTYDVCLRIDGASGSALYRVTAQVGNGGVYLEPDDATAAAIDAMGETPDANDAEALRLHHSGVILDELLGRLSRSGLLRPVLRLAGSRDIAK
jgi:hypothetical protein